MSQSVLRVAMFGTGSIAQHQLAPALREVEGAVLWSVLSRDEARGAAFANDFGAHAPQPVHTSLDSLLADKDLDAVVIATPDGLHAAQTIAAAKAGKHVFVEKPMATDVDSARAMVEACDQHGVRLGVAYHLRWHDGHRRIAARISDEDFGHPLHMRVQWTFRARDASNWRAREEVGRWWGLAGVGTHCLDLVRWFLVPRCGEVVALESLVTRERWQGPHDETAIVALRFESGATAEVVTSVLFESESQVEVYGTRQRIQMHGTLGPHGAGRIRDQRGNVAFEHHNPYLGELTDFVQAVRDGRPPAVDGPEGLRNVELLVAADPGGN